MFRALRPGGRFVGEMGGKGNVATLRAGIRAELAERGYQVPAEDPQWYPSCEEFVRLYEGVVDDSTRVMLRIRAIYRGRALRSGARAIYQPSKRNVWMEQIADEAGRFRAEQLCTELDTIRAVRRRSKANMVAEARRHRAFALLCSVPGVGPVRASELIAIIGDPHRFRTKRQLWPYAGLAVVTRTSG